MQLAFKNSFYGGKFDGIYGLGITFRNWLNGDFNSKAHVELVFHVTPAMIKLLQQKHQNQFLTLKPGDAVSYSSIETDKNELGQDVHGCRFKQISYINYDRWDFLNWNIHDKRFPKQWPTVETLFLYCLGRVGVVGYDWEGIGGQALGNHAIDNSTKTFCSEEIAELMGIMDNPNPSRLYNKVCAILKS